MSRVDEECLCRGRVTRVLLVRPKRIGLEEGRRQHFVRVEDAVRVEGALELSHEAEERWRPLPREVLELLAPEAVLRVQRAALAAHERVQSLVHRLLQHRRIGRTARRLQVEVDVPVAYVPIAVRTQIQYTCSFVTDMSSNVNLQ